MHAPSATRSRYKSPKERQSTRQSQSALIGNRVTQAKAQERLYFECIPRGTFQPQILEVDDDENVKQCNLLRVC